MINSRELYGFEHYLYGEPYLGSCEGMRFYLAREPLENVIHWDEEKRQSDDPKFLARVWFTPLSYENTKEEDFITKEFSFDSEGFEEAVAWFNRMKEEKS